MEFVNLNQPIPHKTCLIKQIIKNADGKNLNYVDIINIMATYSSHGPFKNVANQEERNTLELPFLEKGDDGVKPTEYGVLDLNKIPINDYKNLSVELLKFTKNEIEKMDAKTPPNTYIKSGQPQLGAGKSRRRRKTNKKKTRKTRKLMKKKTKKMNKKRRKGNNRKSLKTRKTRKR